MTDVNVFVAFIAGIFSFLSPCVLPLIPSYLSFVSGVSLEQIRSNEASAGVRRRVVLNSLAFIVGFSLVFVSLGASASYLGSLFFGYRNIIRILHRTADELRKWNGQCRHRFSASCASEHLSSLALDCLRCVTCDHVH